MSDRVDAIAATAMSDQNEAVPPEAIVLRNVLVPTDFSRCSARAMRYAIDLAHRYRAKLHLFHWVDASAYDLLGRAALRATIESAWRDLQQLDMDLFLKDRLKSIKDKLHVEAGELSEVLSRVVKREEIDLIVIGTRGRTGLGKLILGSVAERIFREASCPVLTVGPKARRPVAAGPGSILFPTDFSDQSCAAESLAFSLAHKYHAHLFLLHVLEQQAEGVLHASRRVNCAEQQLRVLLQHDYRGAVKADAIVKMGPPVETIVRFAHEKHVGLVVLGVRASYSASDRLTWPNAYEVMRQCRWPVLTVRSSS
jgi:nucleotide-binding universal stress UspA family protein